jgi:hypothetical protein
MMSSDRLCFVCQQPLERGPVSYFDGVGWHPGTWNGRLLGNWRPAHTTCSSGPAHLDGDIEAALEAGFLPKPERPWESTGHRPRCRPRR